MIDFEYNKLDSHVPHLDLLSFVYVLKPLL